MMLKVTYLTEYNKQNELKYDHFVGLKIFLIVRLAMLASLRAFNREKTELN